MEIRYQSDLYGSYLLLPAENSDHDKYSFKMLERNKIKGVLGCKERMEDGRTYLHIDITGKKNLCQEYQEKEMNLEDMTVLCQSITSILERLRGYLLTEKMVILEPEFIYKDGEDQSYSLLVVPWEREEKAPLRKLAEFFLEKMSHLDENGVSAAYHFYRQQSQPQFSIYRFLSVLEKENILSRQKSIMLPKDEPAAACLSDSSDESQLIHDDLREEDTELEEWMEGESDLTAEKSRRIFYCSLFLSLLPLGLCFLPIVNKNQKISCAALFVILLIFGIMNKIFFLAQKRNRKGKEQGGEEELSEELREIGEETVFFQESMIKNSLKLQWKERGKKKISEIEVLPFTIGKKKDQVSLYLSDPSVSRLHCKIIEDQGQPVLIDLDSTNGTYLNGIRIKKGEKVEIVKNDEILVGKVKILVV